MKAAAFGLGMTLLGAAAGAVGPFRMVGSVKAPDGVEIRYQAAGNGDPAIVFVHGWSCDRSYWRLQLDHFAASHRVVAVDLGGHGESGRGRKKWTIESFGADVVAVVEALDLRGIVLVGHSMGGPVILEAALQAPGRVAALVPVDTLTDVGRELTSEERDGLLRPLRADFPTAVAERVRKFMVTPRTDPKLADRIASDMAAAPPEVALSAVESLLDYDEAAALAAVEAPVRLLNADRWPTNLEAARRHKADIELAVMPGVSHFLMQEDPEEFNRLLARAIRELVAR